jgi:hypothetical protein
MSLKIPCLGFGEPPSVSKLQVAKNGDSSKLHRERVMIRRIFQALPTQTNIALIYRMAIFCQKEIYIFKSKFQK